MRFARLENGDVVPIEYAFDTLKPIRQIGRGGQGVNWLFKRKRDKALLVQKSYNNYKEFSGLPWEVYIMGRVVALHPRILQLEGWHIRKDLTLEIYYPYCEGGDLSQFAPKPGCGQPEAFVWHVFVQLADALASLRESLLLMILQSIENFLTQTYDFLLKCLQDLPDRTDMYFWCRSWL